MRRTQEIAYSVFDSSYEHPRISVVVLVKFLAGTGEKLNLAAHYFRLTAPDAHTGVARCPGRVRWDRPGLFIAPNSLYI